MHVYTTLFRDYMKLKTELINQSGITKESLR